MPTRESFPKDVTAEEACTSELLNSFPVVTTDQQVNSNAGHDYSDELDAVLRNLLQTDNSDVGELYNSSRVGEYQGLSSHLVLYLSPFPSFEGNLHSESGHCDGEQLRYRTPRASVPHELLATGRTTITKSQLY